MSSLRIAHLINPVKVGEDRDLFWQQPIVFQTMKHATFHCDIEVNQYACFYPEDEEIVTEQFWKLPVLLFLIGQQKVNSG